MLGALAGGAQQNVLAVLPAGGHADAHAARALLTVALVGEAAHALEGAVKVDLPPPPDAAAVKVERRAVVEEVVELCVRLHVDVSRGGVVLHMGTFVRTQTFYWRVQPARVELVRLGQGKGSF